MVQSHKLTRTHTYSINLDLKLPECLKSMTSPFQVPAGLRGGLRLQLLQMPPAHHLQMQDLQPTMDWYHCPRAHHPSPPPHQRTGKRMLDNNSPALATSRHKSTCWPWACNPLHCGP